MISAEASAKQIRHLKTFSIHTKCRSIIFFRQNDKFALVYTDIYKEQSLVFSKAAEYVGNCLSLYCMLLNSLGC